MTEESTKEPGLINDNDKQEEASCDEEGLLLKYDVIICGTGLVQSILASALTRVGKSVLHCDGEGYYGELDAVLTLPHLQDDQLWATTTENNKTKETGESNQRNDDSVIPLLRDTPEMTLHSTATMTSVPSLGILASVETPFGKGTIASIPTPGKSLAISLSRWTLANGESPTLYIPIPSDIQNHGNAEGTNDPTIAGYLEKNYNIHSSRLVVAKHLLQQQSRHFAIDISPSLIFASGDAVDGFLKSGVADYLEFKSIEGLLWYDSSGTGGSLSRVPCSKGDVFTSKLLGPLEKRKLMKFLQLVMDYATSQQVMQEEQEQKQKDEATNDNEQGDVASPPPSSTTSTTTTDEGVQSLNERQLNQGRSLARPQNKAVKVNEFLESLQEAMRQEEQEGKTVADFETYLKQTHKLSGSLLALVRHALALETTAKSTSLGEGIRRLCQHLQGLGRFGTTAFLTPIYGSGEFSQAFCRSSAVHGGTYLLRRAPKAISINQNEGDETKCVNGVFIDMPQDSNSDDDTPAKKKVSCDHVVVTQGSLQPSSSTRILRRVSVITGKIVEESHEQRHIILIPPGSKNVGNTNAIHGLVLDASSKVAPRGCSLLHLTTTIHGNEVDKCVSVLENAANALRRGHDEIYHVCFSFGLYTANEQTFPGGKDDKIQGLHICSQASQRLVVDDAFASAKGIFDQICPGFDFLALSDVMDQAVKERQFGQDDEDEEKIALDKATQLLEQQEKEQQQKEGEDEEENSQSREENKT